MDCRVCLLPNTLGTEELYRNAQQQAALQQRGRLAALLVDNRNVFVSGSGKIRHACP